MLSRDPACLGYSIPLLYFKGFHALQAYRVAHYYWLNDRQPLALYLQSRISEVFAVDIHPGARIGRRFFIDHGTGVVIGETTHIGPNVKVYQGVTLGALSFPKDDNGAIVRNTKRHPTIEDDVVIYANATILGGNTTIGHHSVVGSSAWITRSVEPYTIVTIENPRLRYRGAGASAASLSSPSDSRQGSVKKSA